MNHRDFLATLTAQQRQQLTTKSDRHGLIHLMTRITGLCVSGCWIFLTLPGWQLALFLHGIQLVFLFTLLHETTHRTPFRTRVLNDGAGFFCGLILFLPAGWFRHFHFAHHRFTQDPLRDPELADPKPESWQTYILALSGLPVWRSQLTTLIRNARGRCDDAYVPAPAQAQISLEARLMCCIYIGLLLLCLLAGQSAWRVLLLLWLLPALIGQPFLRLYLMAEHGRCPLVDNMFANTRTVFTLRIVRWLAWNMSYHSEHHANPAVPFYLLPEMHRLVEQHLQCTESGYLQFHRRYRSEVLSVAN